MYVIKVDIVGGSLFFYRQKADHTGRGAARADAGYQSGKNLRGSAEGPRVLQDADRSL